MKIVESKRHKILDPKQECVFMSHKDYAEKNYPGKDQFFDYVDRTGKKYGPFICTSEIVPVDESKLNDLELKKLNLLKERNLITSHMFRFEYLGNKPKKELDLNRKLFVYSSM